MKTVIRVKSVETNGLMLLFVSGVFLDAMVPFFLVCSLVAPTVVLTWCSFSSANTDDFSHRSQSTQSPIETKTSKISSDSCL